MSGRNRNTSCISFDGMSVTQQSGSTYMWVLDCDRFQSQSRSRHTAHTDSPCCDKMDTMVCTLLTD